MIDKIPTAQSPTPEELHPDWIPPSQEEIEAIMARQELRVLMETPPEGHDPQRIARVAGNRALRGDLVDLEPARGSRR